MLISPKGDIVANFDGSSKGNPGRAGVGVAVFFERAASGSSGRWVAELAVDVGVRTNN